MKVFIKNIGIVGITNIIVYFNGLLLFIVITKKLGATDFGVWRQLLALLRLLTPIAFLGLATALIRFLPGEKDINTAQETFYSIVFTIVGAAIIISFVLFVSSNIIAVSFMKDIEISSLIRLVALFFPLYMLSEILFIYFQAVLQIKKYASFLIVTNVIEILSAIVTIYFGYGLLGPLLAIMCTRVIMLFLMLPIILKEVGFKWPDFSMVTTFLYFGFPILPISFSNWFIDSGDRYLIGYFLNPKYVGIYSASYVLGSLISFFATPVSTVFFPTMSGLWNTNRKDEFNKYIFYTMKYLMLCIIPFAVILTLLSKPLLFIFSTEEFYSGNSIVGFIAFGLIIYSVSLLPIHILTVLKKNKFTLFSYTLAALTNFILNIIFIPMIGILGAAIATAIGYLVLLYLTLSEAMKFVNFKFDIGSIVKSLLASIVMSIIIIMMGPKSLIGIFSGVFVAFVCYAILIILMRTVTKNEILFLKNLFFPDRLSSNE